MNSKLTFVLGALFGAICGGAGAYSICNKRYNERMKKELASVEEHSKKEVPTSSPKEEEISVPVESEQKVTEENHDIWTTNTYGKTSEEPQTPVLTRVYPEPYFIQDMDFCNEDIYEPMYLTFYEADRVLVNDDDVMDIYDDLENTVGRDFYEYFGASDIIHIRNERLKIDYEIARDVRSFYEDIKPRM